MPMIVRAFPVVASVRDVEAFAAALSGERRTEAAAFYRKYGVSQETWHVQESADGPRVIVVTMLDEPAVSAPYFAAAESGFDAWFKQQIQRITGVDPVEQPLGPSTTQVFAWTDVHIPDSRLTNV